MCPAPSLPFSLRAFFLRAFPLLFPSPQQSAKLGERDCLSAWSCVLAQQADSEQVNRADNCGNRRSKACSEPG